MVNNDKKRTLGALVDSRMREKGLESKHLAKKLNVTPQAVNKWRRGDAIPSSDILPKLAVELGLSVDELLTGEPQAIENKAEGRLESKIKSLTSNTATSISVTMGALMAFIALYVNCTISLLFSDYAMPILGHLLWTIVSAVCAFGGVFLVLWGLHVGKKNEIRKDEED